MIACKDMGTLRSGRLGVTALARARMRRTLRPRVRQAMSRCELNEEEIVPYLQYEADEVVRELAPRGKLLLARHMRYR